MMMIRIHFSGVMLSSVVFRLVVVRSLAVIRIEDRASILKRVAARARAWEGVEGVGLP